MVGNLTIHPNDRIAVMGDSISYGGSTVSFAYWLAQSINASYISPRSANGPGIPGVLADNALLPAGAAAGIPTWFVAAGNGYGLGNVNVTCVPLVAKFKPTVIIIEQQTNDYADPSFAANINTVVANILATCTGITAAKILWVGCMCRGEQRPFGTNTSDTSPNGGLQTTDATLRARATALGFNLYEFRTDATGNGDWLTYETANNPSNLAFGILTADQLHPLTKPTQAGLNFYRDSVLTALTLAGVG